MKKFLSLNLLALGVSTLIHGAEVPQPNVSKQRIGIIRSIIKKYYDKQVDFESKETQDDIRKEVLEKLPVPSKPADSQIPLAAMQSISNKIKVKFNKDDESVRKTAEAEAEKKYPFAKKNQPVKVLYRRWGRVQAISGNFYGYGPGGKTIRLNSQIIPFIDLLEESRTLFDRDFNTAQRQAYVKKQVEDYRTARREYLEQLNTAEYNKLCEYNEKLGYILYNGQWYSSDNLWPICLKVHIQQEKARAERDELEKKTFKIPGLNISFNWKYTIDDYKEQGVNVKYLGSKDDIQEYLFSKGFVPFTCLKNKTAKTPFCFVLSGNLADALVRALAKKMEDPVQRNEYIRTKTFDADDFKQGTSRYMGVVFCSISHPFKLLLHIVQRGCSHVVIYSWKNETEPDNLWGESGSGNGDVRDEIFYRMWH